MNHEKGGTACVRCGAAATVRTYPFWAAKVRVIEDSGAMHFTDVLNDTAAVCDPCARLWKRPFAWGELFWRLTTVAPFIGLAVVAAGGGLYLVVREGGRLLGAYALGPLAVLLALLVVGGVVGAFVWASRRRFGATAALRAKADVLRARGYAYFGESHLPDSVDGKYRPEWSEWTPVMYYDAELRPLKL